MESRQLPFVMTQQSDRVSFEGVFVQSHNHADPEAANVHSARPQLLPIGTTDTHNLEAIQGSNSLRNELQSSELANPTTCTRPGKSVRIVNVQLLQGCLLPQSRRERPDHSRPPPLACK